MCIPIHMRVFMLSRPTVSRKVLAIYSTLLSHTACRKGPLQPVLMTVMQRMGNKKVTVVENLEFYGIPAEKVGHIAQKLAAASTSGTLK